MSRIITFYSYKGGVGRTLALANIGVLLAKRGKRVLLMDWDLEAPGLDRYFLPYIGKGFPADRGIIHLLHEATANAAANWRPHVQEVTVKAENTDPKTTYTLSIIPSGVASADYGRKVSSFSWATFIEERNGGPIIERWRDEWKEEFDFILIDSRTGITDTGGICTVLLPDLLVLVFTANDQSFEGALGISRSAQDERRNLAVQRLPLTILPLLSRFDGRKETDLAETWLKRFDAELRPLFDDWLPKQFQPIQIIELTKIPYVTRFSFGEPLPVLTHSLTDPEFPGFFLENAARLLDTDFRDAARIVDPDSSITPNITNQIQSLIQKAPIDEVELSKLLRVAEEECGESPELANILGETSSALHHQARFTTAEHFGRRALAIDEQSYGPDHPRVALRLNNLAQLLKVTNRLAEAEPMMRRSLAIAEQTYGPEDTAVATRLNNLGELLMDTNRMAEAEPMFRRALTIAEESHGPEDPRVAIYLSNLALLLRATNRLAETEPMLRRTLAIDEKSYGPQHPEVATDLNNLAQFLMDTNRLAEAEPMMERALTIDELSFGSEHPKVALRLNNLAQLLRATNRLDEAETMMRRALAIDEQSYGPEHPSVATRLNNLALLLKNTNRMAEAEPMLRRALAIDEKSYGSAHPDVAIDLNNLAQLLIATNRLPEAEPMMQRAINIFIQFNVATGHDHPFLQTVLDNYKLILEKLGRTGPEIESQMNDLRSSSNL
jgi:tetratricopeptide (TPR) repeat protein/MinD-like ATPase involved in chromosome partitioning or flagellar assembly